MLASPVDLGRRLRNATVLTDRQKWKARDKAMDAKARDAERKIARWETPGGKYWVDLYFNPAFTLANGRVVVYAHYRSDDSTGGIQANTEAEAIAVMQRKVNAGQFQPDAAKKPMKRVLDAKALDARRARLHRALDAVMDKAKQHY